MKQLLTGLLLGLAAWAVQAQTYPQRPVTVIVPFPPGGGTDMAARLLAQKLSARWGQPVQIENRSGVAGLVGAESVARARPDGYTLLMGNLGTQAINPSLYGNMPYDPERAFVPVSLVAELPMVLVVNPGVPARTAAEFVALARSRPGQLAYSSSGSGGAPHIVAELFKQATQTFILHMPYRGGGPAVADLLEGRVQLSFITVLEASTRIKSGKLRALAVSSDRRVPAIPEVPTLAESVAPGFNAISWNGLLAPADTPRELVERIAADVREVLAQADTRRRVVELGGVPMGSTPAQFGQLIDEERKRYARIIREHRIKLD